MMNANIQQLQNRDEFQEKNIKGLVRYAKKITQELEEYKGKVEMAERIINDLKNTGNESLESLVNMLS